MNLNNLSKIIAKEPKYRYQQINKFIFQDYISSWEEASNLPKELRSKLTNECPLEIQAEVITDKKNNKTQKALITLDDKEVIETVLIKQGGPDFSKNNQTDKDGFRYTVCVSTQVGCPLNCSFCATGQSGFRRNLRAEEIVEQVIFWQRRLKEKREKIDNVVFMGMGEPFLNYLEFIKAVKFINNPETINMGARRLSVSTVGIIEGIKRLSGEKLQINLAISLHAANDELRQKLMPVAKTNSLANLFKTTDDYIKKTGRRVMLEYMLIKGVNDSLEEAKNLVKLLTNKSLYLVNLIPYNETGSFQPSSRETVENFKKYLEDFKIPVTKRLSFGLDITAACGQLRLKNKYK